MTSSEATPTDSALLGQVKVTPGNPFLNQLPVEQKASEKSSSILESESDTISRDHNQLNTNAKTVSHANLSVLPVNPLSNEETETLKQNSSTAIEHDNDTTDVEAVESLQSERKIDDERVFKFGEIENGDSGSVLRSNSQPGQTNASQVSTSIITTIKASCLKKPESISATSTAAIISHVMPTPSTLQNQNLPCKIASSCQPICSLGPTFPFPGSSLSPLGMGTPSITISLIKSARNALHAEKQSVKSANSVPKPMWWSKNGDASALQSSKAQPNHKKRAGKIKEDLLNSAYQQPSNVNAVWKNETRELFSQKEKDNTRELRNRNVMKQDYDENIFDDLLEVALSDSDEEDTFTAEPKSTVSDPENEAHTSDTSVVADSKVKEILRTSEKRLSSATEVIKPRSNDNEIPEAPLSASGIDSDDSNIDVHCNTAGSGNISTDQCQGVADDSETALSSAKFLERLDPSLTIPGSIPDEEKSVLLKHSSVSSCSEDEGRSILCNSLRKFARKAPLNSKDPVQNFYEIQDQTLLSQKRIFHCQNPTVHSQDFSVQSSKSVCHHQDPKVSSTNATNHFPGSKVPFPNLETQSQDVGTRTSYPCVQNSSVQNSKPVIRSLNQNKNPRVQTSRSRSKSFEPQPLDSRAKDTDIKTRLRCSNQKISRRSSETNVDHEVLEASQDSNTEDPSTGRRYPRRNTYTCLKSFSGLSPSYALASYSRNEKCAERKSKKKRKAALSGKAPQKTTSTNRKATTTHKKARESTASDEKAQDSSAADKKAQESTSSDKKGQDSTAADKKAQESTAADKKVQKLSVTDKTTQEPSVTNDKGKESTATDQKAQESIARDKKAQESNVTDEKGQKSTATDEKPQELTATSKIAQESAAATKKVQKSTAADKITQKLAATDVTTIKASMESTENSVSGSKSSVPSVDVSLNETMSPAVKASSSTVIAVQQYGNVGLTVNSNTLVTLDPINKDCGSSEENTSFIISDLHRSHSTAEEQLSHNLSLCSEDSVEVLRGKDGEDEPSVMVLMSTPPKSPLQNSFSSCFVPSLPSNLDLPVTKTSIHDVAITEQIITTSRPIKTGCVNDLVMTQVTASDFRSNKMSFVDNVMMTQATVTGSQPPIPSDDVTMTQSSSVSLFDDEECPVLSADDVRTVLESASHCPAEQVPHVVSGSIPIFAPSSNLIGFLPPAVNSFQCNHNSLLVDKQNCKIFNVAHRYKPGTKVIQSPSAAACFDRTSVTPPINSRPISQSFVSYSAHASMAITAVSPVTSPLTFQNPALPTILNGASHEQQGGKSNSSIPTNQVVWRPQNNRLRASSSSAPSPNVQNPGFQSLSFQNPAIQQSQTQNSRVPTQLPPNPLSASVESTRFQIPRPQGPRFSSMSQVSVIMF